MEPLGMSVNETNVNPNKALWEKGDFTRIAAATRESGETLAGSLGIRPGLDVLDLGCGDGTTAVPEAQVGANVLGVDIARNLVAVGNARAESLGLSNLRLQEGDAMKLTDLADDSFDCSIEAAYLRVQSRSEPRHNVPRPP
jgi:ubiquinone/menaquinone biosynthesis C-methylase UbiE